MILTFFYAAALLGLPADYAWRRGRQLAPFGGLVTAAAVALLPWPRESACCTAPGPSPP